MKILFPTDFSETAKNAYIYALNLADAVDGSIITVHAYELPDVRRAQLPNTLKQVYDSITLESFEDFKDNVPYLRDIAREANLEHVAVKHMMMRITRNVEYTIIKTAEKVEADFIIMGTTGASGLKEIFLGSVAAEVLENAHCPVLAVPHNAVFDGAIDNIALATDYSDKDKVAIHRVVRFARWLNARVRCVHIDTAHTEDLNHRMESFKTEVGVDDAISYEVVDHISVEQGLAHYVESNSIDILAMRIKRRNFLQELFTYSTTKKMAYHMAVPILGIQTS